MRYVVVAILLASCASSAEPTYPELTDVERSVARVEGVACNFDIVGTAVFIESDQLVTNAHVVAGVEELFVRLPGGQVVSASLVGFDSDRDLALLTVEPAALTNAGFIVRPALLGVAQEGDTGMIAPLGQDGTIELLPYEVRRQILATGADIYREGNTLRSALDLEADIDPGDSGAGLFDGEGSLVGIVFASSRQKDLVTYAIAATEVTEFLAETDATTPVESGPCI